jgi:hypothetical protein
MTIGDPAGFRMRMWKSLRQFVGASIRRLRRRLAKAIEPVGFDPDPKWDIPISIGLKAASALRDCLGIDEQSYLHVAGQAWHDARAYILYTALDEVKNTSMYLMRLREVLEGPAVSPHTDRLSRLVITHLIEEEDARVRRLLEVLVALILFESTNEQPYYRYLLLLEELEDILAANMDLQEFYGARSANIDDSIDRQVQWIRKHESEIDLTRCWYLHSKRPLADRDNLRPGAIMSNVRTRVKLAMPIMAESEKVIFGFSYAGYGNTSESIHYSVNRQDFRLQAGQELRGVHGLGLLILSILDRCHKLLGRPDIAVANRVASLLDRSQPTALVRSIVVRDIQVGDFVLAYGDLAEIVDVRESPYGYRSYRVRYLAEKPKPNIQEDWFPARYVQRFYTRTKFMENLQRMVAEGELPSDIAERMGSLSDKELQPLIRRSLVKTWEAGLRDWVESK